MNPPRSFKFHFIGTRAHCVRARFRDIPAVFASRMRARGSFNFQHASIWSPQLQSSQDRACSLGIRKWVTDCRRGSRAVGTVHFGAKRWAQFLFEFEVPLLSEGSSWRYDEEKRFRGHSFSLQNEERRDRVQSHRFSRHLASICNGEGISERNPASKIDQTSSSFDVRKMLGCRGQIASRRRCPGAAGLRNLSWG